MTATNADTDAAGGHGLQLDDLLRTAIATKSSDIHLTAGRPPVFRLYGVLKPLEDAPRLTNSDTLALARQATTEDQWAEYLKNRELDFCLSRPGIGRFRANLYWQRGSAALALRAIPNEIPTMEELGLPPVLKRIALADRGLFLVTGPAGSGKSTTMAAMLNFINENKSCHILTIEDPIEYLHQDKMSLVNQREMNQDTLSFNRALHFVLRQDPNVILIGEMRDLETIETALLLAETGHFVMATLHAADTTQALSRIIDVFPPHQQSQAKTQLSLSLVGVISQQLIVRTDRPGRALAFEVLVATPAVSHLIRSGEIEQVYSIIQTRSADDMVSFNSSLLKLVHEKAISREDALQKSTHLRELQERLGKMRV